MFETELSDEDFLRAWRDMSEGTSRANSHMTMKGVRRLLQIIDQTQTLLDESNKERLEQSRLLGMSAEKELALQARKDRLHKFVAYVGGLAQEHVDDCTLDAVISSARSLAKDTK